MVTPVKPDNIRLLADRSDESELVSLVNQSIMRAYALSTGAHAFIGLPMATHPELPYKIADLFRDAGWNVKVHPNHFEIWHEEIIG